VIDSALRQLVVALTTSLLLIAGQITPAKGDTDSLATAFGKVPYLWGAHLSPDGSKVSFLHMVEAGVPVAYVMSLDGEPTPVMASTSGKFDIYWCRWANNERLLCGFYGIDRDRGLLFPVTRLVSVNIDGSDVRVLLQNQLKNKRTQYQDDIVDWLPEDPRHVLVEIPSDKGSGVSSLNIYTGRNNVIEREREGTREWISDGHGMVRLRKYLSAQKRKWYFRLADSEQWSVLHESRMDDIDDDYYPIGFGQNRNALLVYKSHNGHLALMSEDLEKKHEEQVVFSHSAVDIRSTMMLGKFQRLVAVGYATDKPHMQYFDKNVEAIIERISQVFPDKLVSVIDESWDKKFYLVLIGSDRDPGSYYRFDLQGKRLEEIFPRRPELEGRELAVMKPISYRARDNVEIPGYLTLPVNADNKALPTVIMPHGGPESRDVWDFDWLSQYMAAKGYAVLQANFRGSGGYGEAWAGEGGFRQWHRAVNDINDGAAWLINEGIADSERICIVGWSYGGYAALLSNIEAPDLYQCTVSIAGVTDPWTLIKDSRYFLNRKAVTEFVGTEDETINQGSPLRRVKEFQGPVMLFHGDRDINVDVRHSKIMHKALKKAGKNSEMVIYKNTAHSIWRDGYRIDLLSKIGRFLDSSIGANNDD